MYMPHPFRLQVKRRPFKVWIKLKLPAGGIYYIYIRRPRHFWTGWEYTFRLWSRTIEVTSIYMSKGAFDIKLDDTFEQY